MINALLQSPLTAQKVFEWKESLEKENLSVVKGSKLRKCIAYTAKNTAFMHLIIITIQM